MGAAGVDHVGFTGLAPEEGVVDAHDAHGFGMARQKVVGVVDGLPEGAHVPAGQGVRAGVEEVGVSGAGTAVKLPYHMSPPLQDFVGPA